MTTAMRANHVGIGRCKVPTLQSLVYLSLSTNVMPYGQDREGWIGGSYVDQRDQRKPQMISGYYYVEHNQ